MENPVQLKSDLFLPKAPRLKSLDALRGFDMFWIAGGSGLFIAVCQKFLSNSNFLVSQMHHVYWEGFNFFDLIFPLFIFVAGISMAFSMDKQLRETEKVTLFKYFKVSPHLSFFVHLLKRFIILVLLGCIYNGALNFNFHSLRIYSVLGLIGGALFIAGSLALFTHSIKGILLRALAILIGISVLQCFVRIGSFGGFERGHVINVYFDQFLRGHLLQGSWDPEGVMNIVSSSFLALMGCAVGRFIIKNNQRSPYINVVVFASLGGLLILSGYMLSSYYPIIKAAWTPPFNLLACGYSLIAYSFFYCVIDAMKWEFWSRPLQIIGMNSIAIYLAVEFIPFSTIGSKIFYGSANLLPEYRNIILIIGTLLVEYLFLYVLYRKKIFLKV